MGEAECAGQGSHGGDTHAVYEEPGWADSVTVSAGEVKDDSLSSMSRNIQRLPVVVWVANSRVLVAVKPRVIF